MGVPIYPPLLFHSIHERQCLNFRPTRSDRTKVKGQSKQKERSMVVVIFFCCCRKYPNIKGKIYGIFLYYLIVYIYTNEILKFKVDLMLNLLTTQPP